MKIEINEEKRELSEVTPGWINEQIRQRQNAGVPVCVKLYITRDNIDIILSCGDCPVKVGGGGRRPNADEERLFLLWEDVGCDENPVNPGKIIAFLNQVK